MKAGEWRQEGDPGCYENPCENPNLDEEIKEDFLEEMVPNRPKGWVGIIQEQEQEKCVPDRGNSMLEGLQCGHSTVRSEDCGKTRYRGEAIARSWRESLGEIMGVAI